MHGIACPRGSCDPAFVQRIAPALLLTALAACADDCSCTFMDDQAAEEASPSVPSPKPPPPAIPGSTEPDAVPAAAFSPAPDSPEKAKLTELQTALLGRPASYGEPAAAAVLAKLAPAALGDFAASAAPEEGLKEMFGKPVATISRRYAAGERQAYVKITDTASAPELREPFAQKLTLVGNEHTGGQHATFVAGHPTLLSHYPEHQSSTLTSLVGGRYLIDVRVKPTSNAEDAREVLEKLDLSSLPGAPGEAGRGGWAPGIEP